MILLIILSSSFPKSFATEQDVIKDLPGDSLYVLSTNVDRDAISYAEYEKYNIYLSVDDITDNNTNELQARNNLSYGTAFRLNDIDYIPIISNSKIIFLLAILETDGEYSWTLSEDFSQKLNELSELTSVENPARLYTKEGNVYAEISGNNYQLTFNPEIAETNNENSLKSSEKAKATNILNIDTKSIIELNDVSNKVNASQSSKYLKLDLKETQGDQSWCSALAGAQILRYRGKGNVEAKTIMKYFYPKVGDSALKKKSISNKQLIKYANIKRSYPTRKSGTLSLSSVKKTNKF